METNDRIHHCTGGTRIMRTALFALLLIACPSLGLALSLPEDGVDGISVVDYTRTNMNPPESTEWKVTLAMTNYFAIVGFDIWIYLEDFGNTGIVITDIVDLLGTIDIVPFSYAFQDNILQGGTLNQLTVAKGPIFIDPNCPLPPGFNPINDPEPDCSGFPPRPIMEIFVSTPMAVTNNEILTGGPAPSSEQSVFAVSAVINPDLVPLPPPASDSPPTATMKSDPHLMGLRGQEFDVTGEVGKIYNLISDYYNNEKTSPLSLVVNAVFSEAFTSGLWLTPENDAKPYRSSGTWISVVGLLVAGIPLSISVSPLEDSSRELCANPKDCLNFGSATVMGYDHPLIGHFQLSSHVEITVKNSKSYSRFVVESPQIQLQIDVVAPPKAWDIKEEDESRFSHINLQVLSASLLHGIGLIGETTTLKHDEQGKPIMKGSGKDGEGLLNFPIGDYEVSNLIAAFGN